MRMWLGVDPAEMCRKHLLGEHVEIHMLAGCIEKGKNIEGFITRQLVEPYVMFDRHEAIAMEIVKRGYKHVSPIHCCHSQANIVEAFPEQTFLDIRNKNRLDLAARCPECAARMKEGSQ